MVATTSILVGSYGDTNLSGGVLSEVEAMGRQTNRVRVRVRVRVRGHKLSFSRRWIFFLNFSGLS